MASLQISPSGRTLLRNGKPFFWLADTCWSAFTNITDEEWTEYLDLRAEQGFNVLQINALPQWDRCGSELGVYPFPTEDGFQFDFSSINPAYFERAATMCRQAVDKGFIPAIVVMWCNYVPDTWAANIMSGNVIPQDRVEPIVRTICETFDPFDPIYIISGDTGFDAPATIERYRYVTELVERFSPDTFKCYHIKGRYDVLPAELAEHADAYLYQSGHNAGGQGTAVTLAESFRAREPRLPVINSEPCYEQMGYSHMLYGRFRQPEIRAAMWNSILSGACAGITYGANGVWNWQKGGMPKNPIGGEGFLEGFPWNQAVRLPGAWDYAFARKFMEEHDFGALEPAQEVLGKYENEIRAARSGDTLLLYVPTNAPLILKKDYTGYTVTAVDLESHKTSQVPFTVGEDGQTRIGIHPYLADVLLLVQRKRNG